MRATHWPFVLVMTLSSPAAGHEVPAQRSVIVQAEPASVAILVSWTSSNTDHDHALLAQAAVASSPQRAKRQVRALAVRQALQSLSFVLDGSPLTIDHTETKVVFNSSVGMSLGAAILLNATIPPGAHTLVVSQRQPSTNIRFSWNDKSQGAAHSSQSTQRWHQQGLRVQWKVPTNAK